MRALRFLSRVALICNLCFLCTGIILWIRNPPEGQLIVLVIIIGYVLSGLINAIIGIWYLLALLTGKRFWNSVPKWLIIVNSLFIVLQVVLVSRGN
jgi:hypothetical protein